jgi:glycosyltransferase involved in cell wall biosynthesis
MRLLFDLYATQAIGRYKYNGGSEYVRRLFIETIERCDDSVKVFCTYNSKYHLEEYLKEICLENEIVLLDIADIGIGEHVRQNDIDKLYLGVVQRYNKLQLDDSVEVVFVCHDVRNLEVFPTREALWNLSDISGFKNKVQLFAKWLFLGLFLKLKAQLIKNTYENMLLLARRDRTYVVTDSNHTKYMILSQFSGIDQEKIKLLWAPEITYTADKVRCEELIDKKYWLLVSADRWEKNALPIIENLIKINGSRTDKIRLVLVGNLKNTNLHKTIKKHEWITLYDYLERGKLEWLYANCSVFLYPSFVEGFGYPPIEAMKYDKPVVASATSSIMEVCGDAPLYMCPYNKLEIEARLRALLDTNLEHLSSKSRDRYQQIIQRQQNDLVSLVDIILS